MRKTYQHQIYHGPTADVFLRRFAFWVPEPLEWGLVEKAAALLVGIDFAGLPLLGARGPVRTMFSVELDTSSRVKAMRFTADGFSTTWCGHCRHFASAGRRPIESVAGAPNWGATWLGQPRQMGLVLERVEYELDTGAVK